MPKNKNIINTKAMNVGNLIAVVVFCVAALIQFVRGENFLAALALSVGVMWRLHYLALVLIELQEG